MYRAIYFYLKTVQKGLNDCDLLLKKDCCFFHFWCPEMTDLPHGIIDYGSLHSRLKKASTENFKNKT